jgi:hypothetical protein
MAKKKGVTHKITQPKASKQKPLIKVHSKVQDTKGKVDIKDMLSVLSETNASLQKAKAKVKEIQKTLSNYEKVVLSLAEDEQRDEEVKEYTNGVVTVRVSAKSKTKIIPAIDPVIVALEKIKKGLALELATFKMMEISKYLSPVELNKITEVKLGTRRITYL